MALVGELDVLEVLAFLLAELDEPVTEDVRLFDRTARVVHAVDHEELRGELIRELDRATVAPKVAVLIGIAHLLAEVVLEVLHRLCVELVQIADADPGDGRAPEIRLLRGRDERHETAVAPAEHDEPGGIDVRQRPQILRPGRDVLKIRSAPVLDRGIAEIDAVPGRAADVRLEHDESAVDEELRERIEPAEPLPGRSAVDVHERRQLLAGRDIARLVDDRRDLLSVKRRVVHVLAGHKNGRVDRAVVRGEERLERVGGEVVGRELAPAGLALVANEELAIVVDEADHGRDARVELGLAGLARRDVVEDRAHLRFEIAER